MVVWQGKNLGLAARGSGGNILYKYKIDRVRGPGQTAWSDMGGTFVQPPTLHVWNDNYVSAFAVDGSGRVFYKWWDGRQWSPSLSTWYDLGVGPIASRLAVASWGPAKFTIFGIRTDQEQVVGWGCMGAVVARLGR